MLKWKRRSNPRWTRRRIPHERIRGQQADPAQQRQPLRPNQWISTLLGLVHMQVHDLTGVMPTHTLVVVVMVEVVIVPTMDLSRLVIRPDMGMRKGERRQQKTDVRQKAEQ